MTSRFRHLRWWSVVCSAILPTLACAQTSPPSDAWQFEASIYGFLPGIGGTATFPVTGASTGFTVDAHQPLSSLEFAAMGSLDIHKGPWGAFTDVIYVDLSGHKSQSRDITIGNVGLPAGAAADLKLGVKQWLWSWLESIGLRPSRL